MKTNQMKPKFNAALLSVLCTSLAIAPVSARIGETLDSCKQRYGQPYDIFKQGVDVFGSGFYFRKPPFIISVGFFQDKAEVIGYRKIEENALGKGADISDNEIEQLLKLNGGERKWERHEASTKRMWVTEDGQMIALYDPFEHFLSIATKGFYERAAAKQKNKEGKALEGF
jgi:hypothetical protein